MYTTSVPPAALQFSTAVQQNSPTSKTVSNTSALNFKKVHHLVNVLKGDELPYEERVSIVEAMRSLDSEGRADLIDFLASKNGAIWSTLENNACKHFKCTPEELIHILEVRDFTDLLDFWTFIQVQIVPNFLSVAYPLDDPDTFPIRQTIFTALRNKVLLPMLKNFKLNGEERARIRPVLAALCFVTADRSVKHQELMELTDRLMFENEFEEDRDGKRRMNVFQKVESNEVKVIQNLQPPHSQSNQSINRTLSNIKIDDSTNILSAKPRSRTMPKLVVKWENVIKVDESGPSVDI